MAARPGRRHFDHAPLCQNAHKPAQMDISAVAMVSALKKAAMPG